eukprot:1150565-Pelagomonas_calceolata.AAC.2
MRSAKLQQCLLGREEQWDMMVDKISWGHPRTLASTLLDATALLGVDLWGLDNWVQRTGSFRAIL